MVSITAYLYGKSRFLFEYYDVILIYVKDILIDGWWGETILNY